MTAKKQHWLRRTRRDHKHFDNTPLAQAVIDILARQREAFKAILESMEDG